MVTLRTSQALCEVSQYLRDPERALHFEAYMYTMMFGHCERRSWRHWAISPSRDMLAIRLGWGPGDFIDNLRIAMLMEGVGIGPQRYCICFDVLLTTSLRFTVYFSLFFMHYHRSGCLFIQQALFSEDHFCMSHGYPGPGSFSLVLHSLRRSM